MTTGLSTTPTLTTNLPKFNQLFSGPWPPIPQISRTSTHDFLSYPIHKETHKQQSEQHLVVAVINCSE